jgi:hypothetical protein
MKWKETTASECRYGEVAERIWGDAEILWESSEAGWQGEAKFIARMKDGRYCYYEWSYGSCSGCDTWEAAGHSDGKIEDIMRAEAAWFEDKETFERFLDRIMATKIEVYKPLRQLNIKFDAILSMLENKSGEELKRFLEIVKK